MDACASGAIPGRVALVISNNAESGALRRARAGGVDALWLSGKTHNSPGDLDRAICDALAEHQVDVVLLAGYMKKLGPCTLDAYQGRILNTHPALLPKFGGVGMFGMHVHRAVIEAGEAQSGASIHLVEHDYDSGPVIAQTTVAVEPMDTAETLAARVQQQERLLLVETLRDIATGKVPLPGWKPCSATTQP
jgi:phosphoribosylglycinamide formyltransferase 1